MNQWKMVWIKCDLLLEVVWHLVRVTSTNCTTDNCPTEENMAVEMISISKDPSPRKNVVGPEDRFRDRPHARRTHIRPSYRARLRQCCSINAVVDTLKPQGILKMVVLFFGFLPINEPRHEKTCLRGLQPGSTQTGVRSQRSKVEAWSFGYRN